MSLVTRKTCDLILKVMLNLGIFVGDMQMDNGQMFQSAELMMCTDPMTFRG